MPITTKAGPMPTHQRLRTDDGEDVQDRREPSVEQDEKPTVGVRQPRPTLHLAPQNNQLMPERCILRLKSALRLEWRSQDAQHKEDQRYHAARIADSLAPPTRMRFSAHTRINFVIGSGRSGPPRPMIRILAGFWQSPTPKTPSAHSVWVVTHVDVMPPYK